MPTIFDWNGWKFLFYSSDGNEPPHIHVEKDGKRLKIWLNDLKVGRKIKCNDYEVNMIVRHVDSQKSIMLKAWYDYFGR